MKIVVSLSTSTALLEFGRIGESLSGEDYEMMVKGAPDFDFEINALL